MLRNFMTVGSWTMASRVLGFLRDILFAALLGAGPVAEAFVIAFSLPNMFRRFFAEGAFNMAFVPMFSKKLEGGEDAVAFARDALSGLAGIVIILTLIAQLAMPWLVLAMASGFVGDARFDLAVGYGRVAFPYILFISLAALLSGVLNSAGRFAAAAAAPVLLNIILIGAMSYAARTGGDVGRALVWAVPFAGVAQLALVWVGGFAGWFRDSATLAAANARAERTGDHRRACRAGRRCGADQPWWSDGKWRAFSTARSNISIWPTACINCRWGWWQSPLAWCFYLNFRENCAAMTPRAAAKLLTGRQNLRCS